MSDGVRGEEDAALEAVEGIPHDVRITRDAPNHPGKREMCAADMVRSLFAQGCEYYSVAWERERGLLVADGWYETPRVAARYRPPGIEVQAGMSMDLTPMDRARMRNICRRTHRQYFRDEPTDRMLDELIDSLGPNVAARMVKAAIDKGLVS